MTSSSEESNNPTTNDQQSQQRDKGKPQADSSSSFATDSSGNVNVSRGIIGLASNPRTQSVTEGTVADKVNQPSRFPNADTGRVNPVTAEDLDKRIQLERSKAGFDKGAQEQVAIKARTEAQGFKYTPPEEYKNHPGLEATQDNLQEGEPAANESQGEQVITDTENLKG